jgi:hypothetical protein
MKRDLSKTPKVLGRVMPLIFWKYCSACKREFRREPGWEVLFGHARQYHKIGYLCAECCLTAEDAQAWVEKFEDPGPPPTRFSALPPKA